ncbi:ATP-binding protein [Nitratireductor sp. CH_MIT9313-5]|uniref:ATP-binding protein n=1 Tax=Nitratireductor sp. CH_MIT9313-5 TaxID=3107764 RepID=UPI003008BE1C
MRSIRTRLVAILTVSTGLIWLLATGWIYYSTQEEVEQVLDARLMEAARMVNSLLSDDRIELSGNGGEGAGAALSRDNLGLPYDRQLFCQIWSLEGGLVGRSENAPETSQDDSSEGFSETIADGEAWRIYTIRNDALGVRVTVGDSLSVRERLVGDVIKGLVIPAMLILPFMIIGILVSVKRGLLPLDRMARALSSRAAEDLSPLESDPVPIEIKPTVDALNELFRRVEEVRERERSFTAFAAHELKTPLAGVKTQTQIALASQDVEVHARALRQIAVGVDRTSRLVKQLLDLATVEAAGPERKSDLIDPSRVLQQIRDELPSDAVRARVKIEGSLDLHGRIPGEAQFLSMALRNLLENALNHSPDEAEVLCRVHPADGLLNFIIEDEGPGISSDEIDQVINKFARGSNRSASGSGLGLAIVQVSVGRIGGEFSLVPRQPRGLGTVVKVPFEEVH